jgi:hypothetical protein
MRHGWRPLQNYLDVHDRVIRSYHRYMSPPKVYESKMYTPQWLVLTCFPVFLTTHQNTLVRVDIRIDVEVDESTARPQARTFDYTFSANLPGKGTLIRYCSPHPEAGTSAAPGHHAHHHRHDFTNDKEVITLLTEETRPFVGEFLTEVMGSF